MLDKKQPHKEVINEHPSEDERRSGPLLNDREKPGVAVKISQSQPKKKPTLNRKLEVDSDGSQIQSENQHGLEDDSRDQDFH